LPAINSPVRLLFACLLLLSTATYAACPGDAGERLPPRSELRKVEEELARLASECGDNAGYLAYHGAVLNALGRHDQGAARLEQALLLDPTRASAQIDYADSLVALGDAPGAAALLQDILSRPDVPPMLRPELERRLRAIDALQRSDWLAGLRAAGNGWRTAASVTFRVGYESNLNSAPSRDALSLTIPGVDNAVLQLADRFRERGGPAALLDGNVQLLRPVAGGSALHVFAEARARGSGSAPDTDYQQAQGVVAWTQPLSSGDALFSGGATQLRYGSESLYRAVRLAMSRDWNLPACRPRLGLETEDRRYPAARQLDGRFYGVSTGLSCLAGVHRFSVSGRVGEDRPQGDDRAGGEQRYGDLRLAWAGPVARGTMIADLLVSRQEDRDGFSPLLANNAARRLNRGSFRLEYNYPLSTMWAFIASVDRVVQRSNLDLFDVSSTAAYLGLRWQTRP
jgi:tetratricopeptide (TPR) repeat protein